MNKDDSLRLKVSVSPVYADLYKQLEEAGPYYRSRRLLNLALLGLSLEKGHLITTTPIPPAPILGNISPKEQAVSDKQKRYIIPDSAAAAIGAMFDSM